MIRKIVVAALLAFAGGVLAAGVATGATSGAWIVHLTSPSGDVLDTTITVPTTTTTTTTTVPGAGYPSLSHVTFDGDFDSGCQLVGGEGGWSSNIFEYGGTGAIDRSRVGEGSCSFRSTLTGGDVDQTRAELGGPHLSPPFEVTTEQLVYVPSGLGEYGFIGQHKWDSTGCAQGGLAVSHRGSPVNEIDELTRASCSVDERVNSLGQAPLDRWFAIKVHEKFATSGAFVGGWVDTDGPGPNGYVKRLPLTNVQNSNGTDVKFRTGGYGKGDGSVWIDGLHMCTGGAC